MITEPKYAADRANEQASGSATDRDLPALPSIEFRVVRSGTPARRMRLNTTRCTLGSGEGCTVRLNDSALRPMHAVILRDAHRVLLRAYTIPIEVNGYLTGETFLHLGDTFTLGSYHFELISSSQPLDSSSTDLTARQLSDSRKRMRSASIDPELPTDPQTAENGALLAPTGVPRRARLSFLGGGTYVSEALQATSADAPTVAGRLNASARAGQRAESEQLRRELDAWQNREQHWKEQELQTRAELAAAIAGFHQSQERAKEASDAVAQMRRRMSQLTQELESLASDSIEFRQQASQRQERLRQAADAATEAREIALRQRDEANQQRDLLAHSRDEASLQRDQAARQRDELAAAQEALARELETIRDEHKSVSCQLDQARSERDHAYAQRDDAFAQRQAAPSSDEISQQAEAAAAALTQTQHQIDLLREQLADAAEQLRSAREEVTAAYARIEELSLEANHYRDQLTMRDQSLDQRAAHYESMLEDLRGNVKRLESECAAARDHAASAMNDRQLVESLQSRLSISESHRQADRLSWEQEATTLQDAIQELSLELASATGRLTQTQLDHESTQAELNAAYERLTVARKELGARPSLEQWDELQSQLAETEQQLAETEKQLVLLRRDFDQLLERQPGRDELAANSTHDKGREDSGPRVGSSPRSDSADEGESQHNDLSGSVDLGWPTYQGPSDLGDRPVPCDGPSEPFQIGNAPDLHDESWPGCVADVASRLQNYTAHDEAHRLGAPDQPVEADVHDRMPAGIEPAVTALGNSALALTSEQAEPTTADAPSHGDPLEKRALDPSMGALAKQLIARLGEAKSADEQSRNASSSSDSYGAWVASPSLWERVSDGSPESSDADQPAADSRRGAIGHEAAPAYDELDEADDWKPIQSPSVWNLPSSYGLCDEEFVPQECDFEQRTSSEPTGDRTFVISDHSDTGSIDLPSDEVPAERISASYDFAAARSWDHSAEDDEDVDGGTRAFDFHAHTAYAATADPIGPEVNGAAPIDPREPSTPTPAASAEDDSIEAYMNRLLQRVQGHSGPASEPTHTSKATVTVSGKDSTTSSAGVAEINKEMESVSASRSTEVIDSNTPLVPRSQAPEDAGNMAAMRELANATANSAISVSVRGQAQQLKSRAVLDVFQAGVVMVCAFAFYTCGIKIPSLVYVWHTAAALAAALSVFFIIDMLKKLLAAKATYDRAAAACKGDATDEK